MFVLLFVVILSVMPNNRVNLFSSSGSSATWQKTTPPQPVLTTTPTTVQSNPRPDQLDLTKNYYAKLTTSRGVFTLDLFERNAPNTVANFINLANSGYYNESEFYRLIPGVMLQGGSNTSKNPSDKDPTISNPGYVIPDEINWDSLDYDEDLRLVLRSEGYSSARKVASKDIDKYMVAMASPEANSAGSQFVIILNSLTNPRVNSMRGHATVFAQVVDSTNIIDEMANLPIQNERLIEKVIIQKVEIFTK